MKDPAGQIRCDNDLKLYHSLLAHAEVSRVREEIEQQEENRKGPGVRRHLLSTSAVSYTHLTLPTILLV